MATQVDSYRIEGQRLHAHQGWRSALELVVGLELEAFAHDPLLNKLVMGKWERFGRRMYIQQVVAVQTAASSDVRPFAAVAVSRAFAKLIVLC